MVCPPPPDPTYPPLSRVRASQLRLPRLPHRGDDCPLHRGHHESRSPGVSSWTLRECLLRRLLVSVLPLFSTSLPTDLAILLPSSSCRSSPPLLPISSSPTSGSTLARFWHSTGEKSRKWSSVMSSTRYPALLHFLISLDLLHRPGPL